MFRYLFLLLVASASFSISAQSIEWSALEKSRGRVLGLIPFDGNDFFTLRYVGGALTGKTELAYHEEMRLLVSEDINLRVPSGNAMIENVSRLGDNIVVFLSDKKSGVNTLYYQLYSKECIPVNEPVELLSYSYPTGITKDKGYYSIRTSSNNEYLCLEYSIPGKKDQTDRYGYRVVDKTFATIVTGEYESNYQSQEFSVTDRYLSDTGDYFLLAKVYNTNERGKVKDYTSLSKTVLIKAGSQGIETMEVALGGARSITDMTFFVDESGKVRVNGMYGENQQYTAGIFYQLIDFNNKSVLRESFNPFERDFITQGFTDREKKRADRLEEKGKGAPELYSYDFSEAFINPDGSMIGVLEQYFVRVVTSSDGRGNVSYTYHYYYNDLIVYKISADGEFEYTKKIIKRQHSVNDGGYYSSYASYVTGNEMHIMFNDNAKNYDDAGNFSAEDNFIATASYRKKSNVVAEAVVDLATGEHTRKVTFSRVDAEAYAVPKMFAADPELNQLLLFLKYRSKEKIGLLQY